ncbi:MAG: cytochrome c-type biogenesis protein CcmH [Candidatus Acidiferrales bacterium]|jgi:cytochrome c-type biogenesis protein CcmH
MKILLLLLATTVIPPTPSPHQSERIVHLEDSLLAPCCYTQPVSKHMSDIAFDVRKEIGEMVLAGKSDREILDHYKALYGLQILVDPEGTRHKVMYGLPPVSAIAGFMAVLFFIRRSVNRQRDDGPSDDGTSGIYEHYKGQIESDLRDCE